MFMIERSFEKNLPGASIGLRMYSFIDLDAVITCKKSINFLKKSAIMSIVPTEMDLNALEIYNEEIILENITEEVHRLKRFFQSFET